MSAAIHHVDDLKKFVADKKGIPTQEELYKLLKENVVEVTFTKLNGDQRIMPCTLVESYLPPAKKDEPLTQKKVREITDKVIAVWAIESKGFRSFRYDRVTAVKVLTQE
jgi:arginine repressor